MPRRQRGMALLLVLLLVVLLTTLLTEFAFSTLVDLRLTETFRDSVKAYYLAKGGINAGSILLKEDRNLHDSLDETWHQGVIDYPVGDGTVSIRIEDLGGKLVINSLVMANNPQAAMIDRFYRFFAALELPAPADPGELTAALVDWLDNGDDSYREIRVDDRNIAVNGAENAYYQSLAPPYRCKNGPLHTMDELASVKGFTPEVVQRVSPYLTVNGNQKININTAGIAVLMALSPLVDRVTAQKIVDYRTANPLDDLARLESVLSLEAYSALKSQGNLNLLGTTSKTYRIEAHAVVNDGVRRMTAEVDKRTSQILFLEVD